MSHKLHAPAAPPTSQPRTQLTHNLAPGYTVPPLHQNITIPQLTMQLDSRTDDVKQRFIALTKDLHQICNIAGTPGASVGVLHHGRPFHYFNIGYSNPEKKVAATEHTIYGLSSMTKAFVSASIAQLVEAGLMTWDTPTKDILPDFAPSDRVIKKNATITDMLTHATGLSPSMSINFQGDGDALLRKDQLMLTFNSLNTVDPFRKTWIYNGWGYSIAGHVIETLTKKPTAEYLEDLLLSPLGMSCTSLRPDFAKHGDLASEPYSALSDASPLHLKKRQVFPDSVAEVAGGVFSNFNDMLIWARVWLGHIVHGFHLPQLDEMLRGRIAVSPPSRLERSYTPGGWIRTQLPGTIGLMGDNCYILPPNELPELGHGVPSQLVYYHQGSTVGYFSCIILVPETDSAIVVLTNSMTLCDAADWLGQAVLKALLGVIEPVNYVEWTRKTAAKCLEKRNDVQTKMNDLRRPGCIPRLTTEYVGKYTNKIGNFYISVTYNSNKALSNTSLKMAFRGLASQRYELRHLHDEVFEFSVDHDEGARRGRYLEFAAEIFKVSFKVNKSGMVDRLVWVKDLKFQPEGQVFTRR